MITSETACPSPILSPERGNYCPKLGKAICSSPIPGCAPSWCRLNEHGMADFVIERDPNVPPMIHLVGIDSPGLTAAPSIALHVAEMAGEILD